MSEVTDSKWLKPCDEIHWNGTPGEIQYYLPFQASNNENSFTRVTYHRESGKLLEVEQYYED